MTSPITKPAIPTTIRIEPMIGATVSTIIVSRSRISSPMQCIASDIAFVVRAVALRTAVALVPPEESDDDLLEVVIPVEGYADCLLGIEAGALADVCV